MSSIIIYTIGFVSQLFFSARTLVQWILSEKSRKVVSPSIFWMLSLIGSVLLFCYGWLRNDFSIILGQLISYYIYIWNLNIKGVWKHIPDILRIILAMLPFVAIVHIMLNTSDFASQFFSHEDIPLWLLVYGCIGQVTFTCRFIYQWYYSKMRHQSILPVGFWVISLIGCAIIISYGVIRLDPVIIIGQFFGLIVYSRNIIIWKHQATRKP